MPSNPPVPQDFGGFFYAKIDRIISIMLSRAYSVRYWHGILHISVGISKDRKGGVVYFWTAFQPAPTLTQTFPTPGPEPYPKIPRGLLQAPWTVCRYCTIRCSQRSAACSKAGPLSTKLWNLSLRSTMNTTQVRISVPNRSLWAKA